MLKCNKLSAPLAIVALGAFGSSCTEENQAQNIGLVSGHLSSADDLSSQGQTDTPVSIAVQTSPNATCEWHGNPSTEDPMYADDQGVLYLQLLGGVQGAMNAQLALDCRTEAGTLLPSQNIDPIKSQDFVAVAQSARRAASTIRRPLTGDADALSQPDLTAQGYPFRPDKNRYPASYARWLADVSTEKYRVTGRMIMRPGPKRRQPDFGNSGRNLPYVNQQTWSGLGINKPGTTYAFVQGNWTVPQVSGPLPNGQYFNTYFRSSFWVGLDGYGSGDVLQDGTAQQLFYNWTGYPTAIYYAWIEWFPQNEIQISGLPITAGTAVGAYSYIGDANGNISSTGGYGWFYVSTPSYYYNGRIAKPSNANFVGNIAEWIMERPDFGDPVKRLPNYHVADMVTPIAYDSTLTEHTPDTDASSAFIFDMNNSSNQMLSYAYYQEPPDIHYIWVRYQ